jgi:hypothetical protein
VLLNGHDSNTAISAYFTNVRVVRIRWTLR